MGLKKDPDFINKVSIGKDKCISFDYFSCSYKDNFDFIEVSLEEYSSPSYIIFTSGSTGTPKGALLTQRSSISGAKGMVDSIYEMENQSVCLSVPLFHLFGISMAITHLLYGGCLYLPSNFNSLTILKYLNSHNFQALAGIMTVFIKLLDDPAFNKNGYPNVKWLYTAGAPLIPMQCYRVEKSFGNATLLNFYSQSEADAMISMTTPKKNNR